MKKGMEAELKRACYKKNLEIDRSLIDGQNVHLPFVVQIASVIYGM